MEESAELQRALKLRYANCLCDDDGRYFRRVELLGLKNYIQCFQLVLDSKEKTDSIYA